MFRATRLKHEASCLRIPKLSVSGVLLSAQEMPDAHLSVYGSWPLMNSWVMVLNAHCTHMYDLINSWHCIVYYIMRNFSFYWLTQWDCIVSHPFHGQCQVIIFRMLWHCDITSPAPLSLKIRTAVTIKIEYYYNGNLFICISAPQ